MHIIQHAADILHQGGLVAMPTETVYGLAADARNPEALQKIFRAKGRPIDHPLIVHLAEVNQLTDWARDIPEVAWQLAAVFWPGPLTLILQKSPSVLDLITGQQDTVGLRIPQHPLAQALLTAFGGGLAAPSANRFGRISPTTAEAVREELGDTVDFILEGGSCAVGVESTILDLSGEHPMILRPGMIQRESIEAVLGRPIAMPQQHVPRVSGSLESHYAPKTPLRIIQTADLEAAIATATGTVALLWREDIFPLPQAVHSVLMPKTAEPYAHELYAMLRRLDKQSFTTLMVEAVPDHPAWDAVRDRLQRASLSTICF